MKPSNWRIVVATQGLIGADDLSQILGIELRRQGGGPDEIAKHHAERAAFGCRLRQAWGSSLSGLVAGGGGSTTRVFLIRNAASASSIWRRWPNRGDAKDPSGRRLSDGARARHRPRSRGRLPRSVLDPEFRSQLATSTAVSSGSGSRRSIAVGPTVSRTGRIVASSWFVRVS